MYGHKLPFMIFIIMFLKKTYCEKSRRIQYLQSNIKPLVCNACYNVAGDEEINDVT